MAPKSGDEHAKAREKTRQLLGTFPQNDKEYFECTECDMTAKWPHKVLEHFQITHNKEEPTLFCSDPSHDLFSMFGTWQSHIAKYHTDLLCDCPISGCTTNNQQIRAGIIAHLRKDHHVDLPTKIKGVSMIDWYHQSDTNLQQWLSNNPGHSLTSTGQQFFVPPPKSEGSLNKYYGEYPVIWELWDVEDEVKKVSEFLVRFHLEPQTLTLHNIRRAFTGRSIVRHKRFGPVFDGCLSSPESGYEKDYAYRSFMLFTALLWIRALWAKNQPIASVAEYIQEASDLYKTFRDEGNAGLADGQYDKGIYDVIFGMYVKLLVDPDRTWLEKMGWHDVMWHLDTCSKGENETLEDHHKWVDSFMVNARKRLTRPGSNFLWNVVHSALKRWLKGFGDITPPTFYNLLEEVLRERLTGKVAEKKSEDPLQGNRFAQYQKRLRK